MKTLLNPAQGCMSMVTGERFLSWMGGHVSVWWTAPNSSLNMLTKKKKKLYIYTPTHIYVHEPPPLRNIFTDITVVSLEVSLEFYRGLPSEACSFNSTIGAFGTE